VTERKPRKDGVKAAARLLASLREKTAPRAKKARTDIKKRVKKAVGLNKRKRKGTRKRKRKRRKKR